LPETKIITAYSANKHKLNFRKLWKYRTLMVAFAGRDIRTQYAQTKLGVVWSFIQAVTAALIINLFFGKIMKMQVPGIPYIIYAFPGMMAWYYFSYIVNNAGTALIQSQNIIKKVYFPKLILPFYKTLVGLIDHLIWFVVFIFLMIFFACPFSINVLLLPVCILLNIITGLSVAIWLSALTIRYRDVSHFIPYLIGFGVFVTPVFFETAMIPPAYHYFIFFNPMAGVIALYRWCLFDMPLSINYLFGIVPAGLLFISGLYYFRRVEGIMADII